MALSTSEFKGRFGFGTMRLPMVGGEPDYELCNQKFDRFLEAGLNYFDALIEAMLDEVFGRG